ncbi:MAG TPA: mechanosensitive ion channel family protein [Anaeromyxobacter sp.]
MTLWTLITATVLHAAPVRAAVEEHLPDALLRRGPRGLLWWQWLAIPAMVLAALVLGSVLGWATRRILVVLAARTRTPWDQALVQRAARPLAVLWAIALVTAVHPSLSLGAGPESVVDRALRVATYLVLFWGAFRFVDVGFAAAASGSFARASPSLLGLLPLGRKLGKVVLLALALVAILNELGFQVASLLAGLGIGGIALALAAQKTVENLFGSVAIGVDQPFRVGDLVKIDGVLGTVEAIGMRSTRIRTLERTVVTFPNGKLADMRAETFAVRDRIRLSTNLGLVYGTTAAQLRAVIAGIEAALRAHPQISPDGMSVRFTEFKDSSLNVEVIASSRTGDWDAFTRVRQELYLEFMAVVERAGTSFAFPTRTVNLLRAAGPGGREPR